MAELQKSHELRPNIIFGQLDSETKSIPFERYYDGEMLCGGCLQIDFDGAFQIPDIGQYSCGVPIAELGRKRFSWCPMCRLLAAVRIPPPDTPFVADTSEYHLRACSFLTATIVGNHAGRLPYTLREADSPCLLVLSGKGHQPYSEDRTRELRDMINRSQSFGMICPVVTSTSRSSPRFETRRVLSDSIDYHLLQSWYKFCTQYHHKTCDVSSKDCPTTLQVIDYWTEKIIRAPSDCSYVALSYI